MNILFISTEGCFDSVKTGGAVRDHMFVKALSQIGHVDVISFYKEPIVSNLPNCDVVFSNYIKDENGEKNYLYFIRRLIMPLILPNYPYSYYKINKEKESVIDYNIRKKEYDIIACRYIETAIISGLLKYLSKLVIDVDDNPANKFKMYANQEFKYPIINWRFKLQANKIGGMAERLLAQIRCSFYSNKMEPPSPNSVYLHNVSQLKANIPDINESTPNRLLFVGNTEYFPNMEGIRHFVDYIFPLVKKKLPDVELRVVGKGEKAFLDGLNNVDGVVAPGFVDDLTFEYTNARVVIIPIYQGAGTSIKFIEAILMNRPIVSTPFGARGFDEFCVLGKHYMRAEDDADFIEKIFTLLSSLDFSKEMASNAKEIPGKYFSQAEFEKIVKEAIVKKICCR